GQIQACRQSIQRLSERFEPSAHTLDRLVIRCAGPDELRLFGRPGARCEGLLPEHGVIDVVASETFFPVHRQAFSGLANRDAVLMRRPVGCGSYPDDGMELRGSETRK